MSYYQDAQDNAKEMVGEFIDQMVDEYLDNGKVSDDLFNDYTGGDSYHHETHIDKEYDLEEAAQVLKELSEYKETDYGLWQGLEPEQAISAQAAYTYGNAVLSMWRDFLDDHINGDDYLDGLYELYQNGLECEGEQHVKLLLKMRIEKIIEDN